MSLFSLNQSVMEAEMEKMKKEAKGDITVAIETGERYMEDYEILTLYILIVFCIFRTF